ncbi:hypothetical protein NE578_10070, partial [Schaalia odontolytica]|nr:hypothetical protein [Schaalia odontolytica]
WTRKLEKTRYAIEKENNKKKNPNRHPEYDHTGLKAGFPWPAMEIKSRGDQQMVTGLYSFVSSLLLNIPINRLLVKKK